jgi:hypothetical protein
MAAMIMRQFCGWLKNPAVVDTREMSWGCSWGWSCTIFQVLCVCCFNTTGAPLAVMLSPMLLTVGPCNGVKQLHTVSWLLYGDLVYAQTSIECEICAQELIKGNT